MENICGFLDLETCLLDFMSKKLPKIGGPFILGGGVGGKLSNLLINGSYLNTCQWPIDIFLVFLPTLVRGLLFRPLKPLANPAANQI